MLAHLKIILISRIWRKSDFRVWQLSTLVPIKMSVSGLTEQHAPRQTLTFSIVSKKQPLFKSVTRLNPVCLPILTVTNVTVNMGWNTGFSQVTDLNKGCWLLTVLKLNVWHQVYSSVRLDTDILIGTSVLNYQTLKSLFSPLILVIKMIFFKIIGWYIYLFLLYLWAKNELSDFRCQLACYSPKHTSKRQSGGFFFNQKLCFLKMFIFWIWLRFLRYGFFQYWVMWNYLKRSKMCPKNLSTINKPKNHEVYSILNIYWICRDPQ